LFSFMKAFAFKFDIKSVWLIFSSNIQHINIYPVIQNICAAISNIYATIKIYV